MGKLVPKKKSFKLSAKLKARCRYLGIDPLPLTNTGRKNAIRDKISTSACGSWPQFMAQQDDIDPGASSKYKEILVGYEDAYKSTFRADKKQESAARFEARRKAAIAKREANAIALANKLARQDAMSAKAKDAIAKALLSKQEKHATREAQAKNRKAARLERLQAKMSRLKGRRQAAA
jgi:hypothetical protein